MRYEFSRVRHNPPESYGDCLRACVASVLNENWQDVPHFFHDGCEGDVASQRLHEWAALHGIVPAYVAYPGEVTLEQLLEVWGTMNPTVPAILFGRSAVADHCVCILNGKIEHNPAVAGGSIIGPNSDGFWHILLFVVK